MLHACEDREERREGGLGERAGTGQEKQKRKRKAREGVTDRVREPIDLQTNFSSKHNLTAANVARRQKQTPFQYQQRTLLRCNAATASKQKHALGANPNF